MISEVFMEAAQNLGCINLKVPALNQCTDSSKSKGVNEAYASGGLSTCPELYMHCMLTTAQGGGDYLVSALADEGIKGQRDN